MTLAPIRVINMNERKIRFFDLQGYTEKIEEIKKNRESMPILIELIEDFNNNNNKFF